MNDLISRQAAIEVLKKLLYETALVNDATISDVYAEMAENRVETWVNLIPPATEEKAQNDSDTIVHCNLKENAELIAKILDADLDNEVYEKTGEWIVHNIPRSYGGPLYKCTNCTAKYDEIENKRYCPFCGAFMHYRTNDNCKKCNHYVNDGRHIGCGSWHCSFEGKMEVVE